VGIFPRNYLGSRSLKNKVAILEPPSSAGVKSPQGSCPHVWEGALGVPPNKPGEKELTKTAAHPAALIFGNHSAPASGTYCTIYSGGPVPVPRPRDMHRVLVYRNSQLHSLIACHYVQRFHTTYSSPRHTAAVLHLMAMLLKLDTQNCLQNIGFTQARAPFVRPRSHL
jgi:hypothetical protein